MNHCKEKPPILIEESLSLNSLGIEGPLGLNTCVLSSEKWLCVQGTGQVALVNVSEKTAVHRPVKADTAVIHPDGGLLALRSGTTLQLFDLAARCRLKTTELADFNVPLCKWVGVDTLAIVTGTAVLHWSVSGPQNPVVMMTRSQRLLTGVPINYRTNETLQWLLLVTVSVVGTRVVGCSQLHSVERGCSQILDADAAAFTLLKLPRNSSPSPLIAFATRMETGGKLCIALLGKPKEGDQPFLRKNEALQLPDKVAVDIPAAVEVEAQLGIVFVVWKSGFVALHDVETARFICATQINASGFFTTVTRSEGGLLALNRLGQLVSVHLSCDRLIPYLEAKQDLQLAVRLAIRGNLHGADHLITQWFERLLDEGRHYDAAWLAAAAPQQVLRTPQILERLRHFPGNGPSPLMAYFGELLDRGRLSAWEAVELCRPVVQQGRQDLVEKWLRDDRLECSEILGDLLLPFNRNMALSVFLRAGAVTRVVQCFADTGQYCKIFEYSEKMSFTPNFLALIKYLIDSKSDNAVSLAIFVVENGKYPIDIHKVVDLFLENELYNESTAVLKKAVISNAPETGTLQTRLLSLYLQREPHLTDALLETETLTQFDKQHVAALCEQAGLWHRALQLYTDMSDWQRVLPHASCIEINSLVAFFSSLKPTDAVVCLRFMLATNRTENLAAAVHVAINCHPRTSTLSLIQVFENYEEDTGLFLFLSKIINVVDDEDVHQKYAITAAKLGRLTELEMFCRTSIGLNPIRVRNFLMEEKLNVPLMALCDRFDYVKDLVTYFVKTGMQQCIVSFVSQFNTSRLVEVFDCLCSMAAGDAPTLAVVSSLEVASLANEVKTVEVVTVAEKHRQLPILLPWLQDLQDRGSRNTAVHTALAKLAILSNDNPERFLKQNCYYDFLEVGRFCKHHNPELAVIAFMRGNHDEELMQICEENGLVKAAARHLLHRCDQNLWVKALTVSNTKRAALVENISHLVTTESFTSEEISEAVKAFLTTDLPSELVQILETLVFDCPELARHRNLQNLLILSAIKSDQARVKDLITSLHDYDAPDVALIAYKNGLYEEALTIYERCGADGSAMEIILSDLKDDERAAAYAQKRDTPALWTQLGQARLEAGQVQIAVDALVQAGDASCYQAVVETATKAGLWEEMTRYLEVARINAKEPAIDAQLMFVYAKTGKRTDLERMLSQPHLANVQQVAERCFGEGLLEAADILFASIGCHARRGETLAMLGDLSGAVDCAGKAGNLPCWRRICDIALDSGETKVACIAARHIAVQADETADLVAKFESLGLIDEVTTLLESLLSLEHPSSTICAELALLYIRHYPDKCRGYLESWWSKVHVPRVLKALNEAHFWDELALLLENHGDSCEAIAVMMAHPTEAWDHVRFKDLLVKAINSQMVQQVISFYLEYKPLLVSDVLLSLGTRLDAGRVIASLTSAGRLALGRAYLESRLAEDHRIVNDAMTELLIQAGDWLSLRTLVSSNNNIDALALATRLEKHDVLGFRIVSVELYRRSGRWMDAMRVCQRDRMHREAARVASESGDRAIVEQLLNRLLEEKRPESFCATLFHCHSLIRTDMVMELAWRYDAWRFAMPYFIQAVHDLQTRLTALEDKKAHKTEETPTANLARMLTWSPTNS